MQTLKHLTSGSLEGCSHKALLRVVQQTLIVNSAKRAVAGMALQVAQNVDNELTKCIRRMHLPHFGDCSDINGDGCVIKPDADFNK